MKCTYLKEHLIDEINLTEHLTIEKTSKKEYLESLSWKPTDLYSRMNINETKTLTDSSDAADNYNNADVLQHPSKEIFGCGSQMKIR